MTREQETIEILKAYRNKLSDSVSNQLEGDIEAFDVAIEALEQEACEDAISRQAVIDATTKYCVLYDLRELLADIETLPSVSTEKTGQWEFVQYESNPNIGNWHCSECNRIVCGAITAVNPVYSYKYCPNCGCRMVEPQESEDKE